MNELTKHAFLLEINLQCEFVSYATQGMETALNQEYEVDGGAFWFYAQSFLNSSANIAKLLWGSFKTPRSEEERVRKQEEDRDRKYLRDILNVSDGSPLKSRKVRNCFEHFDEKLFDWSRGSKSDVYTNACIGVKDRFAIDPDTHLKFFDKEELKITFKDYEFDLPLISKEVAKINKKAIKILIKDDVLI
ncbi:hypothetical protein [Bacillus cereus]|uniref:hypothetical protein n=1 Tax=Bacillus cereus TaxID=1396 RepID=UPI00019FEA9E|nr:hypothetical protein [Bacillus cereus]EEK53196.1 hypothetical protein bcere0004_55030 [Bacillus cereus BGSC 6E1]